MFKAVATTDKALQPGMEIDIVIGKGLLSFKVCIHHAFRRYDATIMQHRLCLVTDGVTCHVS